MLETVSDCGGDLLQAFLDLNVEMGNLNENSISAWFDTDSKDVIDLLKWLCTLNRANVLYPAEIDQCDALIKRRLLFSVAECSKELDIKILEYAALLNEENNLLNIEYLQLACDLLSKEECKQDIIASHNE